MGIRIIDNASFTGNVGIGTTSPAQKLHINGNLLLENNNEIRQKDSGGTQRTIIELDSSNDLNIGGSYSGALKFIGGGSYAEVMRIHDNGNVGIGTTAPSYKLAVEGAIAVQDAQNLWLRGGRVGFENAALNNAAYIYNIGATGSSKLNIADSLYVVEAGNVGIGTTAPSSPLNIRSTGNRQIHLSDTSDSTSQGLFLGYDSAGNVLSYIGSSYNSDVSRIDFRMKGLAEGDSKMSILGSGKVGIGTTSPSTNLEVASLDATGTKAIIRLTSKDLSVIDEQELSEIQFFNSDADGSHVSAYIKNIAAETYGRKGQLALGTSQTNATNAVEAMRIDENGNVGIGETSPDFKLETTVAESAPSDFITPFSIKRSYATSSATDMYTGMVWRDVNTIQAGIYANRTNSASNYESDLNFYTNAGSSSMTPATALSTAKMTILAGGNVGIGTTSPGSNLSIGTGNVNSRLDFSDERGYVGYNTTYGSVGGIYIDGGGASNKALILNPVSTGNVGIGTTSPGAKLEVAGGADSIARVLGTTTAARLDLQTNSYHKFIQTIESDGRFRLYNQTTNSEQLTVLNAGNVGIGTTSPSAKLTVKGSGTTSATTALLVQNSATTEIFRVRDDGSVYGIGAGGIDTNTAYGKDAFINNTSGAYNTAIGYDALFTNGSGNYNIAMGWQSLNNNTSGSENFSLGVNSLRNNTTGSFNIAIGTTALTINSTGTYNVAIGKEALRNNTASNNVAIGYQSLFSNTSATSNTAIGHQALYSNTASNNTALGFEALKDNTSGQQSVALGAYALANNTTAGFNTAVGVSSMFINTTGTGNVALGYQSLYENTTANDNTAIGSLALRNNTTGSNNTAVGRQALNLNTTGNFNVALGRTSLYLNTIGSNNIAIGFDSLRNNTASNNTAIGYQSLLSNTSGTSNVAVGYQSLRQNTAGSNNTALGHQALYNTTGSGHVAVGWEALKNNTTGTYNVAIGYTAGAGITTGNDNVSIGRFAMSNGSQVNYNVAIGRDALRFNQASSNIAIGFQAMYDNTTGTGNIALGGLQNNTIGNRNIALGGLGSNTTGSENISIGYAALNSNISGNYNIGIGREAGRQGTTANNNVSVGYRSAYTNTTGINNVSIGNFANNQNATGTGNTAVGYGAGQALTSGNNNTFIGNAGNTKTAGSQNIAIGNLSLRAGTSDYNISIGYYNQFRNTTGGRNIVVGHFALQDNTTGEYNAILGYGAGGTGTGDQGSSNSVLGTSANTGNFNSSVILGRSATATADNQFVVGSSSYNAGTITPAPPGLTANFVWDVVINGVPYQVLLA